MIVVDTNVIGYLFLSNEQSVLAERALQKDHEWAAPILCAANSAAYLLFICGKISYDWSKLSR